MIDLRNTCILVKTEEENEMLLKEAEKQGFHWHSKDDCKPLLAQRLPDVLKFCKTKDIAYCARIWPDYTFYEASEILGTKEMSAREFAERIADMRNCKGRSCLKCALWSGNTNCNKSLCNLYNWRNSIDELIEIVKSGKVTVPTPEEKAINTIENYIENPDREALNDEFVDALKLAVEKLKEVK